MTAHRSAGCGERRTARGYSRTAAGRADTGSSAKRSPLFSNLTWRPQHVRITRPHRMPCYCRRKEPSAASSALIVDCASTAITLSDSSTLTARVFAAGVGGRRKHVHAPIRSDQVTKATSCTRRRPRIGDDRRGSGKGGSDPSDTFDCIILTRHCSTSTMSTRDPYAWRILNPGVLWRPCRNKPDQPL